MSAERAPRLPLPGGTHDWQLVQTVWRPQMEINIDKPPLLRISMTHETGTVWLDDIYFGPAPEGAAEFP